MTDFLAALGLVFAIEGLLFASIPNLAKEALRSASVARPSEGRRAAPPPPGPPGRRPPPPETPPDRMRLIGIVSAIVGVGMVWMVRG